MGVGLVMMKEESNEGGNECTQLPPCPGVETEKVTMNPQLKDSSGGLIYNTRLASARKFGVFGFRNI